MDTRNIIRTISNFLFTKANRELFIFLFFFAIASIFWMLITLNDTYEQDVEMTVRYVNVPKNVVLTSNEVDTLRVSINDRGINIVGFLYGQPRHTIDIDFATHAHTGGTGTVNSTDLRKLVVKGLPSSAKLSAIKPDRLTFYYNYGEYKRVPVRVRGQVVPDKLYFISDTIIEPDSITIYAKRTMLDSISAVYTTAVSQTGFTDTLHLNTALKPMAGVKMVPKNVSLSFVTDVLTEEYVSNIPIQGVNMPEGKRLRTFPARVTVHFVTGMKNYQEIKAEDFVVVADYKEIEKNSKPQCSIQLKKWPANISRPRLSVQQVDYLIEECPTP